ncbi:MAG: GNAT family N-acetyltransferase [Planctomycetes bacterium]|nr:GNAT family N-acetyltransferase [Planctomycetota bacterium]
MPEIRTERLLLRHWRDEDYQPFAAMNADPRVMKYFPEPLIREHSDTFVDFIRKQFELRGYGLWAVQTPDAPFIGFIGLHWATFEADFTPALEIGFRLAADHHGKGYATEGGLAVLKWLFQHTEEPEVNSWTAVLNKPSQRVITKLGLKRVDAGDFDHPRVPEGHPLRPHVRFHMSRADWRAKNKPHDA